ncbi:MAG: hypothetical protein R3Y07_01030 [Eubacteriales bacterium]
MDQRLYHCMLKNLENELMAVFWYDLKTREVFFANQIAMQHLADHEGKIDFGAIFPYDYSNTAHQELVLDQLQLTDSAILYDVPITTSSDESVICDIQVGYSNQDKTELFVELTFKEGIDAKIPYPHLKQTHLASDDDFDERLYRCFLTTLDRAQEALFYLEKGEHIPFYANKMALLNFANQDGVLDYYSIFTVAEETMALRSQIQEQLNQGDSTLLHDLPLLTNQGESKTCNLFVGYANDQKDIFFIEILFHEEEFLVQLL